MREQTCEGHEPHERCRAAEGRPIRPDRPRQPRRIAEHRAEGTRRCMIRPRASGTSRRSPVGRITRERDKPRLHRKRLLERSTDRACDSMRPVNDRTCAARSCDARPTQSPNRAAPHRSTRAKNRMGASFAEVSQARGSAGRQTPQRDRPEGRQPRTAQRGRHVLKGTKPHERRPAVRSAMANPPCRQVGPVMCRFARATAWVGRLLRNPRARERGRRGAREIAMTPATDANG